MKNIKMNKKFWENKNENLKKNGKKFNQMVIEKTKMHVK